MSSAGYLVLAIIVGFAISLQGALNNILKGAIGIWGTAFIVNLVGAAGALLCYLFFRQSTLGLFTRAPWYSWLGGLLGVLIIIGVIVAIPRLGMAATLAVVIFGQMALSMVLDHFGLLGVRTIPVSFLKLTGVAVMGLGVWLYLRG